MLFYSFRKSFFCIRINPQKNVIFLHLVGLLTKLEEYKIQEANKLVDFKCEAS